MTTAAAIAPQIVYWHRDLPPLAAEAIGEHVVEATSGRVKGTFSRHDQAWGGCYEDLMAQATARLAEEAARLGGDYAHVGEEMICPRHDDAVGEGWLYGRFKYVLYRKT